MGSAIRFDDYIEFLEQLADELAGAGDRINSDNCVEVIRFLEEQKQLHIPKLIINEGDCLRCPTCGSLMYSWNSRCTDCGQRVTR